MSKLFFLIVQHGSYSATTQHNAAVPDTPFVGCRKNINLSWFGLCNIDKRHKQCIKLPSSPKRDTYSHQWRTFSYACMFIVRFIFSLYNKEILSPYHKQFGHSFRAPILYEGLWYCIFIMLWLSEKHLVVQPSLTLFSSPSSLSFSLFPLF